MIEKKRFYDILAIISLISLAFYLAFYIFIIFESISFLRLSYFRLLSIFVLIPNSIFYIKLSYNKIRNKEWVLFLISLIFFLNFLLSLIHPNGIGILLSMGFIIFYFFKIRKNIDKKGIRKKT